MGAFWLIFMSYVVVCWRGTRTIQHCGVLEGLGVFSSPLTLLIRALFSKYKVSFSDQPVAFGFAGISGIFSAMQHLSKEKKKSTEIYSAEYLAKEK